MFDNMLAKRTAEIETLQKSLQAMPEGKTKRTTIMKLERLQRFHDESMVAEREATKDREIGYWVWLSRVKAPRNGERN